MLPCCYDIPRGSVNLNWSKSGSDGPLGQNLLHCSMPDNGPGGRGLFENTGSSTLNSQPMHPCGVHRPAFPCTDRPAAKKMWVLTIQYRLVHQCRSGRVVDRLFLLRATAAEG